MCVRFHLFGERYFNSRPCERGDKIGKNGGDIVKNFNSRPCERGDPEIYPDS